MKRLLMFSLILILAVGMVLGSCGEPTPAETTTPTTAPPTTTPPTTTPPTTTPGPQEPYGTLRVSMPTFSYESFDYIQGESFFGWSLYDQLLSWNENFEMVGAIAESFTISEDGLTWTFKIREGVTFHNGDPLTSADVMFSVEHFSSPDSTNPWSPYMSKNLDTHSTPDDYTYVYKTVEPELALVVIFTALRILPKDYIEDNGLEYFRQNPIGSGPWKFVSFTSGDRCIMEANTEHWRTVPHFQRLEQYVVPEESTQVAMLRRGEVDIITGITLDRTVELLNEGFRGIEPLMPIGSNVIMPGTWMEEAGPTYDIRVRRALAYAIDYEELCDTFFHGLAVPGGRWFMHPGSWGWDPSWEPQEYDLDMARSLLQEAGYPNRWADPVIQIFIQTGSGYTPDLFQVLQGYWAEAGIQTQINMVDAFQMLGLLFFGATDPQGDNIGSILPWVFDVSWPNNIYHSYNMFLPGGVHATSNDERARELYMEAVSSLDFDTMEERWTEFMTYVYDELFVTFGMVLIYPPTIVGPAIGDFGYGRWISIADAYAGISHAQ